MNPEEWPAVLFEAAAEALYKHDMDPEEDGVNAWASALAEDRAAYRNYAYVAVAAALSVCEAREEFQVFWSDGLALPWAPTKAGAYAKGSKWQRRWVFTTPAEPVPDNGGEK